MSVQMAKNVLPAVQLRHDYNRWVPGQFFVSRLNDECWAICSERDVTSQAIAFYPTKEEAGKVAAKVARAFGVDYNGVRS